MMGLASGVGAAVSSLSASLPDVLAGLKILGGFIGTETLISKSKVLGTLGEKAVELISKSIKSHSADDPDANQKAQDAGELQATVNKAGAVVATLDQAIPNIESKLALAGKIKTAVNNPVGYFVYLGALGVGIYVVVDNWNQTSDEEHVNSIELLAVLGGTLVGVGAQWLFNTIKIGVDYYCTQKEKQRKELTVAKGTATFIHVIGRPFREYIQLTDPLVLKEKLKEIKRILRREFPGKEVVVKDLLWKLAQLRGQIKAGGSHDDIKGAVLGKIKPIMDDLLADVTPTQGKNLFSLLSVLDKFANVLPEETTAHTPEADSGPANNLDVVDIELKEIKTE